MTALLLACCGSAWAATYTVTTLGDGVGACTPAGANFTCDTFRAAITASNLTTTADDSIVFSASGTINVGSTLPSITDRLSINGAGITLNGGGASRLALYFTGTGASFSELLNITIVGFNENNVIFGTPGLNSPTNGLIRGNTITVPTVGLTGFDSIRVNNSANTRIENNNTINGVYGVVIFNTDVLPGYSGTVVSGNTMTTPASGVGLFSVDNVTVSGNTVVNPYENGIRIGYQSGTLPGSNNNIIQNNILRNAGGAGIAVTPFGAAMTFNNNRFTGNSITGSGGAGISLSSTFSGQINNNVVTANTITGNGGPGVFIAGPDVANNAVYANTNISGNGGLGIDLSPTGSVGLTLNDAGDGDTGPNRLQNFPVVTSVVGSTVNFLLDAQANANGYRIDFYNNPGGVDPTGHGEGQVHLGFCTVATPSATVPSSCAVAGANATTLRTTATRCQSAGCGDTATASIGETSEFSGPTLGTIVIVKDAVPNHAQDFAFTTTGTGLGNFSLDDDADATLSNTRTFLALAPGSYGVTEAALAGWSLSGLTCTDPDNGSAVNLGTRTATIDLDGGEIVTCTFTNTQLPRVTISKVSQGGVGTFSFTGGNGIVAQNITTATAGTAVNGAVQTLTAANTATTITEGVPPAGYALTGITCSGLPSGGTATNDLAARTVTLNAAATAPGANVTCTFTNTLQPARVTIGKVSQGGVGTFSFTGSNGIASQNITTATAGTAVNGAVQTLTAVNTATTITEGLPPAGYALTDITCSNLPTGGTATPDLVARTVTLNAAATAPNANVTCTFTNTFTPTVIRVRKALPDGRAVAADQFTLRIAQGVTVLQTATTTGATTSPTEVATLSPATVGTAYTLSEIAASGANLANYATAYSCTNARLGGQTPSGSGTSFSVTPVLGDDLTCTFTNARSADLSITKTNGQTTYLPGQRVTYTLVASNAGPSAVTGATVTDNFPSNISGITWTCGSGTGGGTCVTASGSGNINHNVNLPVGASVTFTATGNLWVGHTGSLTNTASIALAGSSDPTPGNNSATDTDTQGSSNRCDFVWGVTEGSSTDSPPGNILHVLNTATGALTYLPGLGTIASNGNAQNVSSLAIDPRNGRLFAVDNTNFQLRTLAPGATNWANTGVTVPNGGGTVAPRMVMDANGNLFVGIVARSPIYRYAVTTTGVVSGPASVAVTYSGGNASAAGGDFAIAPNGNFYIILGTAGAPQVWLASAGIYSGTSATATYQATSSAGTGSVAGTAFVGNSLYWVTAGTAGGLFSGPVTGPYSTVATGLPAIADLASCDAGVTRTLTLAKNWSNATINDAVTVSVTAPVGTGTPLNAVANTASETDTGAPFAVVAGGTYTITEAFTTGTAAGYTKSLACTGNTGSGAALAYTANALSGTLTVGSTASNIVCTFSNQRRAADVVIAKSASPTPVVAGSPVTFTLVVTNNGPSAADNAVVTDNWTTLPGLDCSTGPATCAASGTTGTQCPAPASVTPAALQAGVAIPALPNGGVVTFTLQCAVTATGEP